MESIFIFDVSKQMRSIYFVVGWYGCAKIKQNSICVCVYPIDVLGNPISINIKGNIVTH